MRHSALLLFYLFTLIFQTATCSADSAVSPWRLSAGVNAYRSGLFCDAISYLKPTTRKAALLNEDALYFLGESYGAMGSYEEALRTFETIIQDHHDSLWWIAAHERAGDLSLTM